ncbi:hypothetical protein CBR_g31632 [Chara braunii]|uniref:Uncharacterized protein n=1 Tax=Chara braunii TaxID=69332 RepID=A0A388LFJ0_CHABU|nr:hypothetical protein CBR_g31632 [Chara braunii]|eukprot:GBG81074.1 hypothetical protein CBR_g31632 [Chara braunii]
MDVEEQFDIMDSEEEAEGEEIDLPLSDAHQNGVRDETSPLSTMGGKQAMEEDVGSTIANTKPDNMMCGTTPKTGGAMEGSTSKKRVLRSRFYEIAKDNLSTRVKQANREAPDHKISDKVNSLFEFLRENHLLEYNAAFYDKKLSPSYKAVIWSVDYRATNCIYVSDILVGCSQGLEGHTGARKKIDSAAAGGGGESVADKEGHLRMQNAMGDEFSERRSSTPQPTLRPSEGISVVGVRSETTPTAGREVVGDDRKDEKIEEDERQKASDEEGPKLQAHEVVKAEAGKADSHSKQS